MVNEYIGVTVRSIAPAERGVASSNAHTPLVIEPKGSSDMEFLEEFMKLHSSKLMEDIAKYGAVLFRGFDIKSGDDFERQILSIDGMRGMSEALMPEPGRDRADGTRFVLHTNTQYKTGGGIDFMGFHSENFYTTDVPRFISFFCITPSIFGGETGLVNMVGVYSDLKSSLKDRLESVTFVCNYIALSDIQVRYDLDHKTVEDFCISAGLPISIVDGDPFVLIYKPCVFEHPVTGEKMLVTNLSVELDRFGFRSSILREFENDFLDPHWAIHRVAWRYPWIQKLPQFMRHPMAAWREVSEESAALRKKRSDVGYVRPRRIGFEFSQDDIDILAQSVRRNFSSFTWRASDVLIIDNMKMEHTGMPGFGRRELRAMICNPTAMTRSEGGQGLCRPSVDDLHECLGEQLLRLKAGK